MVFLLQFPASQINLSQRERSLHIVSVFVDFFMAFYRRIFAEEIQIPRRPVGYARTRFFSDIFALYGMGKLCALEN
jgi:hypothetical protein